MATSNTIELDRAACFEMMQTLYNNTSDMLDKAAEFGLTPASRVVDSMMEMIEACVKDCFDLTGYYPYDEGALAELSGDTE